MDKKQTLGVVLLTTAISTTLLYIYHLWTKKKMGIPVAAPLPEINAENTVAVETETYEAIPTDTNIINNLPTDASKGNSIALTLDGTKMPDGKVLWVFNNFINNTMLQPVNAKLHLEAYTEALVGPHEYAKIVYDKPTSTFYVFKFLKAANY